MDERARIESLDFEAALAELEETVSRLEEGDLALEEALTVYEKGQKLAGRFSELLDKAALRVERLTEHGEIAAVEID